MSAADWASLLAPIAGGILAGIGGTLLALRGKAPPSGKGVRDAAKGKGPGR